MDPVDGADTCLLLGRKGQTPIQLTNLSEASPDDIVAKLPASGQGASSFAVAARLMQALDQMGAIPVLAPIKANDDFPGLSLLSAGNGNGRSRARP